MFYSAAALPSALPWMTDHAHMRKTHSRILIIMLLTTLVISACAVPYLPKTDAPLHPPPSAISHPPSATHVLNRGGLAVRSPLDD
jgi:hypothetical protein